MMLGKQLPDSAQLLLIPRILCGITIHHQHSSEMLKRKENSDEEKLGYIPTQKYEQGLR